MHVVVVQNFPGELVLVVQETSMLKIADETQASEKDNCLVMLTIEFRGGSLEKNGDKNSNNAIGENVYIALNKCCKDVKGLR